MIIRLLLFALLCEGALQADPICNDQEIHDECAGFCRIAYNDSFKNCDSSFCESACIVDYAECDSSCPCGVNCPSGCADCPEHPFCEDECEKLFFCPCFQQQTTTTTTTEISTVTKTTTESPSIDPSDVFILVIPQVVDGSYLESGDGASQISATINAPSNNYAHYAAHALVNGKLHIFGGWSDDRKIARLDDCSLTQLTVRLKEERFAGHAAVSIENGQKALICFSYSLKSCEEFDGTSIVSTFAAGWSHHYGGLGYYQGQPASVGCSWNSHQKVEGLSATGWTNLPDFPLPIYMASLVGLENGSMLRLGGRDGSSEKQTGIWMLKDDKWSRIGELSQPTSYGNALYIGRSVYYFGYYSAIHRLDFSEKEELQKVELIGTQPGAFYFPVLFHTTSDYCV